MKVPEADNAPPGRCREVSELSSRDAGPNGAAGPYYHAGAAHLPTLYDTPGSRKGGQTQPLSDTLSSHDIIRFAPRSQRTPSDATAITVPPHTLPDYDRVPPDTNAKNVSPPLRPTVRRPTVTPAKPATPPPVSPELSCVRRSRSASPVPQQLAPARLLGSKQHREISPARHAAADPRSGSAAGATALSYHSDAVTVSGLTQAEIHKILF
ncbi:hypothetical protein DIPPA_25786 [Diplonema papillatum]|nr:hypothetical protein DIPPA_25786 [Diplonema papillatum]